MRTHLKPTLIFLLLLLFSFIQPGCTTTRKTAVACPEFPSYKDHRQLSHHRSDPKRTLLVHNSSWAQHSKSRSRRKADSPMKLKSDVAQTSGVMVSQSEQSLAEYNRGLLASVGDYRFATENVIGSFAQGQTKILMSLNDPPFPQETDCDTIILRSGARLTGKVQEINLTEVKYKKCNNLTGPDIILPRAHITKILYSNGTSETFDPVDTGIPANLGPVSQSDLTREPPPLKSEGLGITGFIASLVGLFVASIPLGLIAVVFGSISLSKIQRYPKMYRGRGLAIASIIIGTIDIAVMLALLATM